MSTPLWNVVSPVSGSCRHPNLLLSGAAAVTSLSRAGTDAVGAGITVGAPAWLTAAPVSSLSRPAIWRSNAFSRLLVKPMPPVRLNAEPSSTSAVSVMVSRPNPFCFSSSSSASRDLRISRSICVISIASNCCARRLISWRSASVRFEGSSAMPGVVPLSTLSITFVLRPSTFVLRLENDQFRSQCAGCFERLHDGDDVARAGAERVQAAHHRFERRALLEHQQLITALVDIDLFLRNDGRDAIFRKRLRL